MEAKTLQINFKAPASLATELKIICILTDCKQSEFIRIAIQEKIKQLKGTVKNAHTR